VATARRMISVAFLCAVALPVSPAAASAQAGSGFGAAVQLKLPAGAVVSQEASLFGLACTSPGDCVAGASYDAKPGETEAALISESHGTWSRGVEVRLPANAARQPDATINGIACARAGSCVAVGNYSTASGVRAFLVTESSGRWQRARQPLLPTGASLAATSRSYLEWVACPAPGGCEAVGNYTDKADRLEAMADTEQRGHWLRPVELLMPANAAHAVGATPFSLACPRAGDCVAAGFYATKAGSDEAMGLVESDGLWARASQLRLPANASRGSSSVLAGVACAPGGGCKGTGWYQPGTSAGLAHAMTVSESGGSWARGEEITALPAGADYSDLAAIACPASGFCLSVGGFFRKNGPNLPLVVSWDGSRWSLARAISPPANAATGKSRNSFLTAVSCPSPSYCEMTGFYRNKAGKIAAMAVTAAG
jgi:hypothetical protein